MANNSHCDFQAEYYKPSNVNYTKVIHRNNDTNIKIKLQLKKWYFFLS